MAHDPHHDSIIENLKEIFARCSEIEDRLEFLVSELEAHADFDGCGDRREIANILEGYRVEFDGGGVSSYKHLRQYCVAYQEGSIGCPDCFDYICDTCGEHKEGKPEVVNTDTLAGVVMCRDCHTPKDNEPSCACGHPSCGNTQERVEEQIERLEHLEKLAERVAEQHKGTFQKLADNPVYDEDFLDDEEEALLNNLCDVVENE